MSKESKAVRVIPFDVLQDSWHMSSRRFLAKAQASGTKTFLLSSKDVPVDGSALDTEERKEARSKNEEVYTERLLSCNDEMSFGCVGTARTAELQEGDASEAWKNLLSRYESTTEATKVELKL